MNKQNAVLEVTDLTKDFGNNRGIFNVSFTAGPREIIGFVGPNGSGKSTTINILTGLVGSDSGEVRIFDTPVVPTSAHKLMKRLGVMYSESILDESKTAEQVFKDTERLLDRDCSDFWLPMAEQLELDTAKRIKKLSLGNKKKVAAIRSLMHQPELIIMDEPTSGLDPIIKEGFMNVLRGAADNGATVLLSSHDLSEVQHICSRIIMIKNGKIIIDDVTNNILSKLRRRFRLIRPNRVLIDTIAKLESVQNMQLKDDQLIVHTSEYQKVIEIMHKAKFYDYFIEQPSLEDAFKEKYV